MSNHFKSWENGLFCGTVPGIRLCLRWNLRVNREKNFFHVGPWSNNVFYVFVSTAVVKNGNSHCIRASFQLSTHSPFVTKSVRMKHERNPSNRTKGQLEDCFIRRKDGEGFQIHLTHYRTVFLHLSSWSCGWNV